jgi:2-C-methyl-D-erythritol 4-phosphate cytidylyltransferase
LKRFAIIVAGGSGTRINPEKPKQFLLLDGKPILIRTLEIFYAADPSVEIVLVLPEKETEEWKSLCNKYKFTVPHQIVTGGETRFHSVKNGLNSINGKGVVAVHDGVRPFASTGLINKCFEEAEKNGNAVPCIPVAESIRKVSEKGLSEVADRNSLVIIQTPQCFDSEILKKAYSSDFKDIFTDDATVVEHCGYKINLIEGERENIKITYPFDLKIAKSII